MTSENPRLVRAFMSTPVHIVKVDDSLGDVQRILLEQHISSVVVAGRDGKAMGVLSYTDLLQLGHIYSYALGRRTALELPGMCVGDVLQTKPVTLGPDEHVDVAVKLLIERRIQRLYVVEDDKPIGVLSTRDLLRAVIDAKISTPVEKFMLSPVPTMDVSAAIGQAVTRLVGNKATGIVVLENGAPAGMITQAEALAAKDLPRETPVGDCVGYSFLCVPGGVPLFRVAAMAIANKARRVLVIEGTMVRGALSGLEFCKALLPEAS